MRTTPPDGTPNPPLPLSQACINGIDGTAIRACKGIMHIYAERPGWCQCGQEFWDEGHLTSADIPEETG